MTTNHKLRQNILYVTTETPVSLQKKEISDTQQHLLILAGL